MLEAISCGLPVVGFDTGAMRELCFFSKELLAHVSDDLFQQYDDFNPEKLKEKIHLAISSYIHFRTLALQHSHLYSFEDTGAAYVQVFDKVQREAAQTFDEQRYQRLKRRYQLESLARRWYGAIKRRLKP